MSDTPTESPDPAKARALLAALAWQVELGADEAIADDPFDRYEAVPTERRPAAPAAAPDAPPPVERPAEVDAAAAAQAAAQSAGSVEDLAAALQSFPHCELRRGARSFAFADGRIEARVMIVGEAPDRAADREGRPFAGAEGALLDRMLAAIGLSRQASDPARAAYLTLVSPWRLPPDGRIEAPDMEVLSAFLARHVALAQPDLLVLMGNLPCKALLGEDGITRLRGQWGEALGRPALPMRPPGYLLERPAAKRQAWADLLSLRARLEAASS
ncbi:uracil-DNA glycosylase [Wenxinia saemankumensis]|uniref:DNA polymerase n=1 Tax=Wenxinia saemankumensis TaxID=1447782 RepID=A0A1M6FYH9_9RHOB|nr:uracil-DNA glycosylase [Wenxinia saemankumensis]SHJ02805.1 DNA polymerase [Wenxinia saemankumensis]